MIEKKELIKLFNGAKEYIEQGMAVVPINDETGLRMIAYSNPKKVGDTKDHDAIFKILSNSTSNTKLALITGALSKNLECIDIDEKYNQGVSARFLSTIKEYYPEIFQKIRIEQTKNKGVHIYYTIDEPQSQSKDIAKRFATSEELQKDPKRKTYAFIEIKGNNSSFTCYPSSGYSLIQDKPIPHLSQDERDTLINIAKGFNEVLEKIVEAKVSKKSLRNYSTNPWDDYNSDETAFLNLVESKGWEVVSQNNSEIRFSRPGQKRWVSACYYRQKQLFVVYTSSSELEAGNYRPSSLLSLWNFGSDNKDCFAWLIENGYGKLERKFETKLIQKAVVNNLPLPKNISSEAFEEFELNKNDFENKYPYGLFWEQVEEKNEISYRINRELILRVATSLNFKIYRGELVFLDDKIIKKSNSNEFYKALKSYVKEDEKTNVVIFDKFENYIQQAGKFLISRLPKIEESEILHDNHTTCFKAFSNIILKITKRGVERIEWHEIDKLILDEKVIDYDYKESEEKGLFVDFIKKSILDHSMLREKIGWMVHDYNDSINPYFLILTETSVNPKDGGGSGKDLFSSLVGMMTTCHFQDGGNTKVDKTFFQSWRNQRLMLLSDIGKKFPFSKIKPIVSNTATIKRLYQDEVSIPIQHLPKIVCTSNYSFETKDGGVERRLRFIEFSDFFTKSGGVASYYNGKRFPRQGMNDDWGVEDWDGYYSYIINCIVAYFKNPILKNVELTESGWKKQFAINHGEVTFDFIVQKINLFKSKKLVAQTEFQNIYDNFCNENGVTLRFRKSAQGLNEALEDYCNHYSIFFEKSRNKSVNGLQTSCKVFETSEIEEQVDNDLPF